MAAIVKVAFRWAQDTVSDIISTFHADFTPAGEPSDAQLDALIDLARDWWNSATPPTGGAKSLWPDEVVLQQVTAQTILPTPRPARSKTYTDAGTNLTSPTNPPQVCVAYSLKTAIASRRTKGRMYLPPPPNANTLATGNLTATYHSSQRDAANTLLNQISVVGALNWKMAVFSRVSGTTQQVTDILVGVRTDTQRRRLPRETAYLT